MKRIVFFIMAMTFVVTTSAQIPARNYVGEVKAEHFTSHNFSCNCIRKPE